MNNCELNLLPCVENAHFSNANKMNTVLGMPTNELLNSCMVCGDMGAKKHYGIMSCLGCKGFFRRALKKAVEYECLKDGNCVIDKFVRTACRYCRFQKCLQVGMDPATVRPDRDVIGKQRQTIRLVKTMSGERKSRFIGKSETSLVSTPLVTDKIFSGKYSNTCKIASGWIMQLPVEMRTMLMTLLNIEAKVVRGDTVKNASEIYPLGISTIRELIDEPIKLRGRRTEIRYEPYRMARNEELSIIAYRRLIATIDWVELLSEIMDDKLNTDDRIALVKSAFGSLALFKCSAKTAIVTNKNDLLCLCNFAYIPRNFAKVYNDAYHLDDDLVNRLIDQLVAPFRKIHLTEEEIVCLSAIIVLNPMAKGLSETASINVGKLRERVLDTLYQIVKISRRNESSSAPQFGNLLLFLPIITDCANTMNENLRFAQTFSTFGRIPILASLFGCFPAEPLLENKFKFASLTKKTSEHGFLINDKSQINETDETKKSITF